MAHPDARALKIEQDRRGFPATSEHAAKLLDPSTSNVGSAMRSIDADDVHSAVKQCLHLRRTIPGRTEGRDDFGAAHRVGQSSSSAKSFSSLIASCHRCTARSDFACFHMW